MSVDVANSGSIFSVSASDDIAACQFASEAYVEAFPLPINPRGACGIKKSLLFETDPEFPKRFAAGVTKQKCAAGPACAAVLFTKILLRVLMTGPEVVADSKHALEISSEALLISTLLKST